MPGRPTNRLAQPDPGPAARVFSYRALKKLPGPLQKKGRPRCISIGAACRFGLQKQLILNSIKMLSKAFYSAEGALEFA